MAYWGFRLRRFGLFLVFALMFGGPAAFAEPIKPKVVIVTTFEVGADTGDKPGELQYWVEREKLTETIPFAGGPHTLLTNKDQSILAITTGMSLINAGPSIMALGTDPRFDLTKSYWIVAGIAGLDPQLGAIGSGAWAKYVVSDIAQSIDMREAPKDWPYGIYVAGTDRPNELPKKDEDIGPDGPYPLAYTLNGALTEWAYAQSRNVKLDYTPEMKAFAKRWTAYPATQKGPTIFIGDSFASNHYWHGEHLNQYARDWVPLLTGGKGKFAMSNMEDSAIAAALHRLNDMGRADWNRFMVLRTASNYTIPAPKQDTNDSLTESYPGEGRPAYEAAYRAGAKVAHTLIDGWDRYESQVPGTAK
jgi:purine nucleoside permease